MGEGGGGQNLIVDMSAFFRPSRRITTDYKQSRIQGLARGGGGVEPQILKITPSPLKCKLNEHKFYRGGSLKSYYDIYNKYKI